MPDASAFRSHCHDRMENGWLALHRAIGAFPWRLPLDSKREHPPLRSLHLRRHSFLSPLRAQYGRTADPLSWLLCAMLLAGAPLLTGIVNKLKARFSGRFGPSVFQPYHELWRLARKETIYSTSAGFISRLAPVIVWCTAVFSILPLPLGQLSAVSFPGDIILFAYMLALGRFFQILAAFDVAGNFEGMGASRAAGSPCLPSRSFSSPSAVCPRHAVLFVRNDSCRNLMERPVVFRVRLSGPALFLFPMIAECSRIPVDDPNTHLELDDDP